MSGYGVKRSVPIQFLGRRMPFMGLLLSGLVLMVPTLGLYRFWLVTRKRDYYWGHTEIDGDALEYTGTPTQLLIGFLLAVLIFLPIYVALFYVSVRLPDFSALTYLVLVPGFYFLMGYAAYRSRRFRLSRTLWRGIRFQQSGNAWAYALRRVLWTLLTILTLGLAYPFMSKSLWRYRIEHTLFGDRPFAFTGRVRSIAVAFYGAWIILAALMALAAVQGIAAFEEPGREQDVGFVIIGYSTLILVFGYFAFLFVSARIDSRFWSSVSLGEATVSVRIKARNVALQHLLYSVLLSVLGTVFGIVGAVWAAGLTAGLDVTGVPTQQELARLMQDGSTALFVIIGLYLVFLGLWSALNETILGFGYWKIVTRGATIDNIDSLATVRAAGTESPLAGEGLADALNVGAY